MHQRMDQPTKEETKKNQLYSAQRDPQKKKPLATGPHARAHYFSQDHPLLDRPEITVPVGWALNTYNWSLLERGQLPPKCVKAPGVADRDCQPEPERKSLMLEYVSTKYPED